MQKSERVHAVPYCRHRREADRAHRQRSLTACRAIAPDLEKRFSVECKIGRTRQQAAQPVAAPLLRSTAPRRR